MGFGKKMEEAEQQAHSVDNQTSDEWYNKYIEQYKDSEFYEQLRMNPYLRANNAPYQNSFLENIFGGAKGSTQYYEDLVNARNEYMTEILAQMREQAHNDPAAEVARRKAAGLNDDLSGGQAIGTGEAAQNDQPAGNPPNMMGGLQEVQNNVATLWSCFTNAYSLTSALLKDAQVLKSGKIANENGEIENFVKWLQAGGKAVEVGMHGNGYDKDDGSRGYGNLGQAPAYFFSKFFRNGKRLKKFESAYNLAQQSVMTTRKAYQESTGLKQDIIENEQKSGEFNVATENNMLREWSADMFRLSRKLQKIELATTTAQLKGMGEYYRNKDFKLMGQIENETLGSARKKIAMENTFNNFMDKWSSKLEKQSQEDGISGIFASVMLGMLSLQSMNMMPSIGMPNINVTHRAGNNYVTNNNM